VVVGGADLLIDYIAKIPLYLRPSLSGDLTNNVTGFIIIKSWQFSAYEMVDSQQ
jgi:hypothetical protein